MKNFLQFVVNHTFRGFYIVNKAEVDVFPELFCFFSDPTDVNNLISGSSLLSATRVVSFAYLRSLIFLPAILVPAYTSSSPPFHMMYSAYKLKKKSRVTIYSLDTPFPIWNQSVVPCPVLTVAS